VAGGGCKVGDRLGTSYEAFREEQPGRKILVTARRAQHDAGIQTGASRRRPMLDLELQRLLDGK
jgi:hypothetical protein